MQSRFGPHPAPHARGDAGGLVGEARRLPDSLLPGKLTRPFRLVVPCGKRVARTRSADGAAAATSPRANLINSVEEQPAGTCPAVVPFAMVGSDSMAGPRSPAPLRRQPFARGVVALLAAIHASPPASTFSNSAAKPPARRALTADAAVLARRSARWDSCRVDR